MKWSGCWNYVADGHWTEWSSEATANACNLNKIIHLTGDAHQCQYPIVGIKLRFCYVFSQSYFSESNRIECVVKWTELLSVFVDSESRKRTAIELMRWRKQIHINVLFSHHLMLKKHWNRIDEMPTPVTPPSFKLKAIVAIDDNAIESINCVLHDSILLDTRFSFTDSVNFVAGNRVVRGARAPCAHLPWQDTIIIAL